VVVVVGGAIVPIVPTVCTAGLVPGRSFLENERGSRRVVKSMPDPAALMSATPIPTVRAIARKRPILTTNRGIGEEERLLETHSTGAPWLGEVAGQASFPFCVRSWPAQHQVTASL